MKRGDKVLSIAVEEGAGVASKTLKNDEIIGVAVKQGDELAVAMGSKVKNAADEVGGKVDDIVGGGLKSGLTPEKIQEIIDMPKGSRPDPSTYLRKEYIDTHLALFEDGASIIMTKEQYISYVKGSEYIGIPSDGTQFVMPKNYCDDIGNIAKGDISVYEKSLGFDIGHFEDGGGLVRIDIKSVDDLNLRMPSGNEAGANSHWLPGGKTDGGVLEAVTDLIPNISDNIIITELK